MIYIGSILISFVAVFLKGFQHKNVIGNHVRSVFFTSYVMAVFDVLAVTIIVQGGLIIALTSGTGAAFGMVAAIYSHNWLYREKKSC